MMNTVNIVGLVLALSIIILNLCEIWLLHKEKRKCLYKHLLLSLSVSDLFLGLSELSSNIAFIAGIHSDSPNYVYMTYFFFLVVSILHLLFISIDRLYAVAYPIHHKTHQKEITTKSLIATSWTVSFVMTGGYVINYFVNSYHIKYTSKTQYCDLIIAIITYILISANVLYIIIYSVIAYLIWSRKVTLYGQDQVKNQIKKQKRGILLCACTVLTFIVFTSPFSFSYVQHPKMPEKWTFKVLAANSAVNSIIFLLQEYIKRKVGPKRVSSDTSSNKNAK